MYICICNPFTDGQVKSHLDTLTEPAKLNSVYKACSGGAPMNCGRCGPTLKTFVDDHNSKIAVGRLTDTLRKVAEKKKETV